MNVRELAPKKEPGAGEAQSEADLPTHQIVFYAFGCKRIVEGRLKENHEDRVVFQVQEKEYEFSSAGPSLP